MCGKTNAEPNFCVLTKMLYVVGSMQLMFFHCKSNIDPNQPYLPCMLLRGQMDMRQVLPKKFPKVVGSWFFFIVILIHRYFMHAHVDDMIEMKVERPMHIFKLFLIWKVSVTKILRRIIFVQYGP